MWTAVAIMLAAIASIVTAFPAQNVILLSMGVLAILIAAPIAGNLMLDSYRETGPAGSCRPASAVRPDARG
jgi:hypothetical protein